MALTRQTMAEEQRGARRRLTSHRDPSTHGTVVSFIAMLGSATALYRATGRMDLIDHECCKHAVTQNAGDTPVSGSNHARTHRHG
jgi:hypothetical protein